MFINFLCIHVYRQRPRILPCVNPFTQPFFQKSRQNISPVQVQSHDQMTNFSVVTYVRCNKVTTHQVTNIRQIYYQLSREELCTGLSRLRYHLFQMLRIDPTACAMCTCGTGRMTGERIPQESLAYEALRKR